MLHVDEGRTPAQCVGAEGFSDPEGSDGMGFSLRCGDVVPGCPAEVQGDSEEQVLSQAAEHARTEHGMESMDDTTVAAVRDAIRSS
jgi:predicted small metal-binding protein